MAKLYLFANSKIPIATSDVVEFNDLAGMEAALKHGDVVKTHLNSK